MTWWYMRLWCAILILPCITEAHFLRDRGKAYDDIETSDTTLAAGISMKEQLGRYFTFNTDRAVPLYNQTREEVVRQHFWHDIENTYADIMYETYEVFDVTTKGSYRIYETAIYMWTDERLMFSPVEMYVLTLVNFTTDVCASNETNVFAEFMLISDGMGVTYKTISFGEFSYGYSRQFLYKDCWTCMTNLDKVYSGTRGQTLADVLTNGCPMVITTRIDGCGWPGENTGACSVVPGGIMLDDITICEGFINVGPVCHNRRPGCRTSHPYTSTVSVVRNGQIESLCTVPEMHPCADSPCVFGECVPDFRDHKGYRCLCDAQWHVEWMDEICDFTPCSDDYCLFGYCVMEPGRSCICSDGYSGRMCDVETNECASQPCFHVGTCTDHVNHYTCQCQLGYTGANCELNIDECASRPCVHGDCLDGVNEYTCARCIGYRGVHCEEPVGCLSSPCGYGGTCHQGEHGGYLCVCPAGFQGTHCEHDRRHSAGSMGMWSEWSESSCSKSCDNGLQARYRDCLEEPCWHRNADYRVCQLHLCKGNDLQKEHSALLSNRQTMLQVLLSEKRLKMIVATHMNQYCKYHPGECCAHLLRGRNDVVQPAYNTTVLTEHNVVMVTGYPRKITRDKIFLRLAVMAEVSKFRTACTLPPYRTDLDVLPPVDTDVMYLPGYVIFDIIHSASDILNNNKEFCCFKPLHNADELLIESYPWDIVLQIVLPLAVIIAILLVILCVITMRARSQVRKEPLDATSPAIILAPAHSPRMRSRTRQSRVYDVYDDKED